MRRTVLKGTSQKGGHEALRDGIVGPQSRPYRPFGQHPLSARSCRSVNGPLCVEAPIGLSLTVIR
jgi:hypothetical protein